MASKAEALAEAVNARLTGETNENRVHGTSNSEAIRDSDVVQRAVPYNGHDELVATLPLAGKLLISCVNPMAFHNVSAVGVWGLDEFLAETSTS